MSRYSFGGRGSRADGGRHARTRARTARDYRRSPFFDADDVDRQEHDDREQGLRKQFTDGNGNQLGYRLKRDVGHHRISLGSRVPVESNSVPRRKV